MPRTPPAPRTGLGPSLLIAGLLCSLAGCSSTPKPPPTPVPRPQAAKPKPTVIPFALSLRGVPYRWGGNSPAEGFDCSGFVRYVYGRYGVDLPRRAVEQAAWVPQIPVHARQPGDLVFFDTGTPPVSHVGIYIGQDAFVHASTGQGGQVIISDLNKPYWREHLVAIGRPPSRRW